MNLNTGEITAMKKLLNTSDKRLPEVLTQLQLKLNNDSPVELFTDGAADLHTKTAGIGGVFYRNGEELFSFSEFIGSKTNNEAEYSALIKGLQNGLELNIVTIKIYSDSQLIVRQINGEYKVKHANMKPLHALTKTLLNEFDSWEIKYIPREENTVADKLSKDGMISGR